MLDTVQIVVSIFAGLVGSVGGALGAYVAIRSDLASLKAIAEMHGKSLERAHIRIDTLQENR